MLDLHVGVGQVSWYITQQQVERWRLMQDDVAKWARRNFGDSPITHPFLGLLEELGEWHDSSTLEQFDDALGDQSVYAMHLAHQAGLGVSFLVTTTMTSPPGLEEAPRDAEWAGRVARLPAGLLSVFVALSAGGRTILKHQQGIRGVDVTTMRTGLLASMITWFSWANNMANMHHISPTPAEPLLAITERVWSKVRERDWVKNPESAHQLELSMPNPKSGRCANCDRLMCNGRCTR